MEKFSIICPCCEATLTIDAQTGALLAHEEKAKKLGSFEDLKANSISKKKFVKISSPKKCLRKKTASEFWKKNFKRLSNAPTPIRTNRSETLWI